MINKNTTISLTDFVMRQFKNNFNGTNLSDYDNDFVLDKIIESIKLLDDRVDIFVEDGYADFCKLLFIPNNFLDIPPGVMEIDMSNFKFLNSQYIERREGELPVLTRSLNIPKSLAHELTMAEYLMVVLYSKEQINLEKEDFNIEEDFKEDYGIVSINALMYSEEEPMNPMTLIRNSMPLEFGGSGILQKPSKPKEDWFVDKLMYSRALADYEADMNLYKLEVEKFKEDYSKSVQFWEKHALLKLI